MVGQNSSCVYVKTENFRSAEDTPRESGTGADRRAVSATVGAAPGKRPRKAAGHARESPQSAGERLNAHCNTAALYAQRAGRNGKAASITRAGEEEEGQRGPSRGSLRDHSREKFGRTVGKLTGLTRKPVPGHLCRGAFHASAEEGPRRAFPVFSPPSCGAGGARASAAGRARKMQWRPAEEARGALRARVKHQGSSEERNGTGPAAR